MAQNTSIFASYVDKFFKGFVGRFTELFNGKREAPTYLYTSMLTEEYTPDLTWNSTSLNNSIVAADVVAMDSSLPLKKRSTISRASGDVAKIGMKLSLKEKQISDIMVMQSKGQQEADIARRVLDNVPKVINGIHTRVEIMFEQALSSGQVLVSSDNEGVGIRVDFGYKAENTFHATTAAWSSTSATPLDDIRQLFDAASNNSDTISDIWMSEQYFNYARKTEQVKELVAANNNQVITASSSLPVPNRSKTLEALNDEFSATFHIINNSYKVEDKAGNQTPVKPWVQPNIVGTPSAVVGRLVYGTLAEDLNRVAGVTYSKSGFILVSEYSVNEPSLAEFTASQALAMPVIDDGEHIYILHADGTGVVSVDPTSLSFTASANNVGKKVKVHSDKAWTAAVPVADSWATVTYTAEEVTVKVSANSGSGAAKRTTTLTITDSEGNTAEVEIEQAA